MYMMKYNDIYYCTILNEMFWAKVSLTYRIIKIENKLENIVR